MSGQPLPSDGPGADPSQTPPLTNRGCLTPPAPPKTPELEGSGAADPFPVLFHLDYLKLTIFEPLEVVQGIVETSLYERSSLPITEWIDTGCAKHWKAIYQGPGPVMLLVPQHAQQAYTTVELRGQGCAAFEPDVLLGFLAYIVSCGSRWHGLRVDIAFDHVLFTPQMIDDAIRRGDIRSRSLGIEDRDWNDNALGQTAYLGGRRCKKPRKLRVYNKRGFNRCEGELHGEWATSLLRKLAAGTVGQWPRIAQGMLRGMVDFVDSHASRRIERCPLLPWWDEFIGQADKIRNLDDEDRRRKFENDQITIIGKSEMRLKRASLSLLPMINIFGAKYVIDRLLYFAKGRERPQDLLFAAELKENRYSGLAGLPTRREAKNDEDVPF